MSSTAMEPQPGSSSHHQVILSLQLRVLGQSYPSVPICAMPVVRCRAHGDHGSLEKSQATFATLPPDGYGECVLKRSFFIPPMSIRSLQRCSPPMHLSLPEPTAPHCQLKCTSRHLLQLDGRLVRGRDVHATTLGWQAIADLWGLFWMLWLEK